MKSFLSIYIQVFFRPEQAFETLQARPARLPLAGCAVAITAVSYLLVYVFLARNGGRPTVFHPWLAIPPEEYYRYNQFFVVPSIALAWIAAAGFTHLAARALGGKGTFDDTFVLLGFGLSVSTWWTGLHDLVTTFLGFVDVIDQRAYEDALSSPTPFRTLLWTLMAGYLAWFLITFAAGVRVAQRLKGTRAWVGGGIGFVVYQLVFVLFNR